MAADDQAMERSGLSSEELAAEQASELPDREAMSLLDLDVDLNAAIDAAAPINAAVAANANVAAPIDAAVGANVGSNNAVVYASADQDAAINQTLNGVANATSNQGATVDQSGD
jgi:hypothetical protein